MNKSDELNRQKKSISFVQSKLYTFPPQLLKKQNRTKKRPL